MTDKNIENEHAKRSYFKFLKHADGKSETTVRMIEKSIRRFEVFTGFAGFKTFNQKQAIAYKADLAGGNLSKASILSEVNKLKRFLKWLSRQAGYKTRIMVDDVDYLSLSERDTRAASSPAEKDFPTLAMVKDVIVKMPSETPIEKRNRAAVVICALTGIRGGALISLKLKHFQRRRMLIVQDPNEVHTKFGKRINSMILPVCDEWEVILLDWVDHLEKVELFSPNDPLLPSTLITASLKDGFQASGLARKHWQTTAPLRTIFREAFLAAGLPNYTPHRFRDMLVKEMYDLDLSIVQFRAWSLSLGHANPHTTLTSYGKLSVHEMESLIRPKRRAG